MAQQKTLVKKASIVFFLAGISSLVTAIGYSLIGIPGFLPLYSHEESVYLHNRLFATTILANTGLYFLTIIIFFGAILAMSSAQTTRRVGKWLLAITILPNIQSIITLPLLTPQDITHTIGFVVTTALLVGGLFLL